MRSLDPSLRRKAVSEIASSVSSRANFAIPGIPSEIAAEKHLRGALEAVQMHWETNKLPAMSSSDIPFFLTKRMERARPDSTDHQRAEKDIAEWKAALPEQRQKTVRRAIEELTEVITASELISKELGREIILDIFSEELSL